MSSASIADKKEARKISAVHAKFYCDAIISDKIMTLAFQEKEISVKNSAAKIRRIAAAFLIFWYALLGWLRLVEALKNQEYLLALKVWPRPFYLIASGLVLGLGFSLALLLVAFRARFAPIYFRILAMIFLGWLWFDRAWLGTRAAFLNQFGFTILISIITLAITFLLIRNEDYFRKDNHDKQ